MTNPPTFQEFKSLAGRTARYAWVTVGAHFDNWKPVYGALLTCAAFGYIFFTMGQDYGSHHIDPTYQTIQEFRDNVKEINKNMKTVMEASTKALNKPGVTYVMGNQLPMAVK